MMSDESLTLKKLKEQFGDALVATHSFRGDDTAVVPRERIIEVCRFLKDDADLDYDLLRDVTAVDYLGEEPRFEMVYHLYSVKNKYEVRLKARVPESDCTVDSVVPLWPAANWLEREVFEMYGVRFNGHPNLKPLLLYDEFQGYPLRKDYPIKKAWPLY